jgi:hypothetical protein
LPQIIELPLIVFVISPTQTVLASSLRPIASPLETGFADVFGDSDAKLVQGSSLDITDLFLHLEHSATVRQPPDWVAIPWLALLNPCHDVHGEPGRVSGSERLWDVLNILRYPGLATTMNGLRDENGRL